MSTMKIFGEEIESIFELVGYKEDAITFSTACGLPPKLFQNRIEF